MKIETLITILETYNKEKLNPTIRIELPSKDKNVGIHPELIGKSNILCGDEYITPVFTIDPSSLNMPNISSILKIIKRRKFKGEAKALVVLNEYDFNRDNMSVGRVLEIGGVSYDPDMHLLLLLTNYTNNHLYEEALLSGTMFNCIYFDRCINIATKLDHHDVIVLDRIYNIIVYFEGKFYLTTRTGAISFDREADSPIVMEVHRNSTSFNNNYKYKITKVSDNDLIIAMYKTGGN